MNGSVWEFFQRNIEVDFHTYFSDYVQNIDGILIRSASEMFIDDVRMSNMMTTKFYNLGFGAVGGIISEHRFFESPSDLWYHYDGIANVANVSESSGYMYRGFDQDSFGLVYGIYNSSGYVQGSKYGIPISPAMQNGYHQTTKKYDLRTNMYDFNFRLYDPVIGRFIQQEPLGLDGPNPYHFTFNNPVNSFDPNGLFNLSNPFTWGV